MDSYRTDYPAPARRGSWLLWAPVVILVILIGAWCVFWFYATGKAKETIAGWLAREAEAGRLYACTDQSIGGFPFRFELRCAAPQAEFRSMRPPLALRAADILVALQVYQPNLLIGEVGAPLVLSSPGQPAAFTANWSLGRGSVRGTPRAPERVSLVFDDPTLDRHDGVEPARPFAAKHAELHGRIAAGTVRENPVVDIALNLVAAVAPSLHPLAAQPFDADLDTRLVGLRNFNPKPWGQRFREIQEAGGHIEVRAARLRQGQGQGQDQGQKQGAGDVLAVAAGTLKLTEAGRLNGELQVTVAGLDKLLPSLGADQLVQPGSAAGQRLDSALNSLDRVMPGLGSLARQKAGLGVAAGAALLGQPAELEGRKAVRLPLRFVDGDMLLGPLKLGKVAPLF
jgi:hypothetical protein